jgi:plasmid stabilization system protein ParE
MSLTVVRGSQFLEDIEHRAQWYASESGPELSWKFEEALNATLDRLCQNPTIGHPCAFRNPLLQNLRSITVNEPFGRLRIFYRFDSTTLHPIRLMHGARDLGRRLLQPND